MTIKIKNLTKEQLIISFDRLTRFKYTEDKYLRVFKDIILSNLIEPKFKKKDLDNLDYKILRDYAVEIINFSLSSIFGSGKFEDFSINFKIKEYENAVFHLNSDINVLLENKINYNQVLKLINKDSVKNLQWLKYSNNDIESRENLSLRFPLELVVISEGITEEILLPVFAKKCGYDFDKKGVQIISAGGKNQVVKLFYTMSEQLNIPIFVLLDNDAKENFEQIKPKLRKFDKIHLLNCGEFEDILPRNLILKTLNDHFVNLNTIDNSEFTEERTVKNLEEIFKRKGFHEFKKAEFAQLVKSHVDSDDDISDEIREIINEISVCHLYALQ